MVFHNRQSQTQMILASQVPDAVKYTNTNTVFKWKWAKMDEVDEYVWKWMIINGWKWSPKKNFTEHWNWISVGDYGTLRTGDIEDRRLWGQATLRTGDVEDRRHWGQNYYEGWMYFIGYMLPTFGNISQLGGFLWALRAQGWEICIFNIILLKLKNLSSTSSVLNVACPQRHLSSTSPVLNVACPQRRLSST